jgi:TPR repeat protein
MRSAMERPVRREASRLLLDAAGILSRGVGFGVKLVDEINRKLAVLGSISDGSRSTLPGGLEESLGELYDLFLLMWEAQMRVHRGLPRDGRYRLVKIMRVEDWRELNLTVGSMIRIFGFWSFRCVVQHVPRFRAVGAGEMEVLFEMAAEDLRVIVERGARGYACSADEGLLPPFAMLQVRALVNEPKFAVVELMDVGWTRRPFPQRPSGASRIWLRSGRADEAEAWFERAAWFGGKGGAAKCVERAARLGHVGAMCRMGELHRIGEGVPVEAGAACAWYRRAAELGNAEAMYNLGVAYGRGAGVPIDAAVGCAWYRKAAELGNAEAMFNLGVAYGCGAGVPVDARVGCGWYRKAAELGNAVAMINMGLYNNRGASVTEEEWHAF